MSASEQQRWYYASPDHERNGPVSTGELSVLAGRGEIGPKTLVWSEGYPDWVPAEQIADLLAAHAPASAGEKPAAVPPALPAGAVGEPPVTGPPPAEAVAPAPSPMPREIKPRKGSFVTPRIALALVASVVAGGVVAVVSPSLGLSPWLGLVVFAAGAVLGIGGSLVAYRKERYEIMGSRVLCHAGGLVSDRTTELEIRNITHVKVRLPWLRYKFFGVGNVMIETAGNARPVVLHAIREPEAVYDGIRELMRRHGYDLSRKELLHEERPAIIGVLGECLGVFSGAVAVGLFILPTLVENRDDVADALPRPLLVGGLGVVFLALVGFAVLRFLDFRRRTYRVYNDVVVYEEGFLTRENAFIPYENIADSNTKCSFFDRVFGLFDVQVSCQGSGSDIKFRRLRHGVALSAAIDRLVVLAREKPRPSERRATPEGPAAARVRPRRHEPTPVPLGEAMVAELKMDPVRTLVPLLFLLPLVPVWIVAMIQSVIRVSSTQYSVRPGSVRHAYRFLSVQDREFAYDKITGLVVKRNLWDRMFGTLTLRFWSIGSGQPLEFAHVKEGELDLPALMRQAGIPAASAAPYDAVACFGFAAWLRAGLKFLPLWLIFVAGTLFAAIRVDPVIYYALVVPVLAGAVGFLYSRVYHARQRLRFHEHHVEALQGVIATRRYYARYGNVKRTRTTRYPGGSEGELQVFVAGEEEVQTGNPQKKGQQRVMRPCSFTTGFLPGVRDQGMLLDDILSGRVEPSPEAVAAEPPETRMEASRSVGCFLARLTLLSVILVPLVVLLPLTLPLAAAWVKRWRYRIGADRIVVGWGMLYRSETSILIDRVDSLQQSQGPLNKLFRNGNVLIMTAGSSNPDLRLVDSPDYLALFELIREDSQ